MFIKFSKAKVFLLLSSLFLIGFFIGFDVSVLTAKPYKESLIETPFNSLTEIENRSGENTSKDTVSGLNPENNNEIYNISD